MKEFAAAALMRAALLLAALVAVAHAQVNAGLGEWGDIIDLPVIPVASALRADGGVLVWSAWKPNHFDFAKNRFVNQNGGSGVTQHAVYLPSSGFVRGYTVDQTGHDMFCPGISLLHNGDMIVSGGQDSDKTSRYDSSNGGWTPGPDLINSRGYATQVTLSGGKALTIGGSWSGGRTDPKTAELYNPATDQWELRAGISEDVILTNDPQGKYRADNYAWLFPWKRNTVFHAGPSTQMNWFWTNNSPGRTKAAGTRPSPDSHNGNAVMFDAALGKILTMGGSEAFARPEFGSHGDTVLITLNGIGAPPTTKVVGSLNFPRVYGNAVVLPSGQVAMIGGAEVPKEFVDDFAILDVEIWDQGSEQWTVLDAKPAVPRTYHSSSILLQDGRIFHGGGGLCGTCDANHLNAEIFSPPYLFNGNGSPAFRPTVSLDTATAPVGGFITITTNQRMSMVAAVRHGAATHSTNLDQRRYELCGPNAKRTCWGFPTRTLKIADDFSDGIMIKGHYMIFVFNRAGVPSLGQTVLIT